MRILSLNHIVLIVLFLLISCSENEYEKIDLICRNHDHEIFKDQNTIINSLIQSGEDILYEIKYNYNFSFNLPKRFEYCGEIPVFMCSIGEPDKYFAIDSTLTEEIIIKIESNKNDQINYDIVFPAKMDSIQKTLTPSEIAECKLQETYFIKNMGLIEYVKLTPTLCLIDKFEFVGYGFNGFSKRGYPHSEYNIYGYKNDILVSLFYRTMGNIDQKKIKELYCITNDLKIKMK